jgi:hypothetical protein
MTLENGNMEEVHVIKDAAIYKIDDELTHQHASLNNLHRIMDSEENLLGYSSSISTIRDHSTNLF